MSLKYHRLKMRNRLLPILLLFSGVTLCFNVAHGAMINDSTVVVLAKWSKNEKHLMRYSQYEYELHGNDTIFNSVFSRDFTIVVDDSTTHLYSLSCCRKNKPTVSDSIVLDEFPLRLMTNHSGALIKVLNWDAYLAWRDNDAENTSDALFPYVSLLSFNGKRLRLNHKYMGTQVVPGYEVALPDSVVSQSQMIATQDFKYSGDYGLITVNTVTTYSVGTENRPIDLFDKFTQVVDSEHGWAIATYSSRHDKRGQYEKVTGWNIKLLD